MSDRYRLGRIVVQIEGMNSVAEMVRRELGSLDAATGDDEVQVAFRFVDRLGTPDRGTRLSDFVIGETEIWGRAHTFDYVLRWDQECLEVDVEARVSNPLSRTISRIDNWNYLLPEERVAKDFMYDLFDFTTQLAHLKTGSTYVHASSFERDGRGVAIVAWGGVGKTTSLLKMVLEERWRFLSDDLGLIDSDGRIYRTPKWMQIYAYNLQGEPAISNALLDSRGLVDRMAWSWKQFRRGVKGVRRRVSAHELFGPDRVAESVELSDVFFLERAHVPNIETREMSVEDLSSISATILLEELQPLTEVLVAAHSASIQAPVPGVVEFFESARHVFEEAFAGRRPKLIRVPLDESPTGLAACLRRELESS